MVTGSVYDSSVVSPEDKAGAEFVQSNNVVIAAYDFSLC